MTAGIHYSFVVDAPGRFGYQAYLLSRSLIEHGGVAPADISGHLVSGTDAHVETVLRDLGIRTRWVEPFGHPYANRLQALQGLDGVDARTHVLLDTDMFSVRPMPVPEADAVSGKVVDLPNPSREVLEGIFKQAGLEPKEARTDIGAAPTVHANFNGGLYVLPRALIRPLSDAWIRWARWSLENIALYGKWSDHVDQVSFALAVAELGLPVNPLPREYNTPTHHGIRAAVQSPILLHYHRHVDDQLLLLPTGAAGPDEAIEFANRAILRWRRQDLCNPLFWAARYDQFPDQGSGVGSRGDFLDEKRRLLRRMLRLPGIASVVDIGGGDGVVFEGLAGRIDHRVTDLSSAAAEKYLARNPAATFVSSDITTAAPDAADLAVCLDVLIHIADRQAFRHAVDNVIAAGRAASLVSGYDAEPRDGSSLTHYHEPLREAIERDPETVTYAVIRYREVTGYAVQRGAGTGHQRDARPETLRAASALSPAPLELLEIVMASRREIGFFPDHLPRCIEYPWLIEEVRATGRTGLRILDAGAGINVLPVLLHDDGHLVTTVDGHSNDRTDTDRREWSEWGFLDYSHLRTGIRSFNRPYEDFRADGPFDIVYSISVIEHLPAATRRAWLAKMAADLAVDGRLLLTVDLEPGSRALWRQSEGVDVEAAEEHGTLDDLLSEMDRCGLVVDPPTVHETLPRSRVGIALVSARPRVAPAPLRSSGSRPEVTVLVPAYRPGDRFVALVESIARQTYPNITIRVSLDHAPDHVMPALPDLAGMRLETISQPRRLGWVGNVNAALGTVTSPYFLNLMHDDQLSPEYIAAAVDVLEKEPGVVVAHGTVRHHGVRDGDQDRTGSIRGERAARVRTFLDRGPHLTGLGWRGVVRSELLKRGMHLRTRRTDGMFSNDLMGFEMVVHGESVHVPGIYYDKYTDPEGLSRDYHRRTPEQRSAMLADSLACFVDVLAENHFSDEDQVILASRWAEWLLGLQGNWNVVSNAASSDGESYAAVRSAMARFAANVALSGIGQRPAGWPRPFSAPALPATSPVSAAAGPVAGAQSTEAATAATGRPDPRSGRRKAWLWRLLLRLPGAVRGNPLFDSAWYLDQYPDVRGARLGPYLHYRRHGVAEGRDPNRIFRTRWYLERNPDVRHRGLDPLDHFLAFGAGEGRDPGPEFDTAWYMRRYPDVARSGMNPLLHYLRHGADEGRAPKP